jgi:hypothetical protein
MDREELSRVVDLLLEALKFIEWEEDRPVYGEDVTARRFCGETNHGL